MSGDPKNFLRACAESLLNAVSHLENESSLQTSSPSLPNQSENSQSSCPKNRESILASSRESGRLNL